MLEAGTEGYQELVVTMEDTALAAGSGGLRVLATPVMCALMEKACWKRPDCLEKERIRWEFHCPSGMWRRRRWA